MGRELNRAGIGRSSSSSVTDSIKKTGTQRTDSSGQTKEEAIKTNLRLRSLRRRLETNYETAKQALVNLHIEYEKSKEVRNPFNRYPLLKSMIKEVVRLEQQYWTLLEVPRQEKGEPVPAFVLRACSALEKVQVKPADRDKPVESEDKIKEEKERLEVAEVEVSGVDTVGNVTGAVGRDVVVVVITTVGNVPGTVIEGVVGNVVVVGMGVVMVMVVDEVVASLGDEDTVDDMVTGVGVDVDSDDGDDVVSVGDGDPVVDIWMRTTKFDLFSKPGADDDVHHRPPQFVLRSVLPLTFQNFAKQQLCSYYIASSRERPSQTNQFSREIP
ncbi:hypothetical protein Fcan01_21889 [Folsomia candida]|uniref:Uncharacterized protein n=1 Tax=Folsomia candida TaxID=158441 RepID=A0A226DE99_FOLCA|nr:hypothetical protein Fcan01_21889 [Folsomia candida]